MRVACQQSGNGSGMHVHIMCAPPKNVLGKAKQTPLQPKMRIRKAEEAKRFDNEILHESRLIPQVWVDSQPSTGMQTDDWQGIGRSNVMLKSQAFTALIDTAGLDKTCVSLGQQPLPMRHVWASMFCMTAHRHPTNWNCMSWECYKHRPGKKPGILQRNIPLTCAMSRWLFLGELLQRGWVPGNRRSLHTWSSMHDRERCCTAIPAAAASTKSCDTRCSST